MVYLGWLHFLAIMSNVAMKMYVQAFVWTYILNSLGDILRSGIYGSYGNSSFNFLKNCRTVFQSSGNILPSHQQYMKVHSICRILHILYIAIYEGMPSFDGI